MPEAISTECRSLSSRAQASGSGYSFFLSKELEAGSQPETCGVSVADSSSNAKRVLNLKDSNQVGLLVGHSPDNENVHVRYNTLLKDG